MNYPSLHPAVRQYVHPEATKARDGTGQNVYLRPSSYCETSLIISIGVVLPGTLRQHLLAAQVSYEDAEFNCGKIAHTH